MLEKVCHIGPAFNVQGGISSVLVSYKKLFNLPERNFIASYNGSFVKSLPQFLLLCLKLLLNPPDAPFVQIHTSFNGSFFRKYLISLCLRLRQKKYVAHIHGSRFKEMCVKSPKIVKRFIRSYFKHSAMVICITPDMQEFLDDFVGKGLCRYVVIPNPCDSLANSPVDLNRAGSPVRILFAGRYGHRKGVYDLLEAFKNANFDAPAELCLFGDGEVEKVKQIAERYNAEFASQELASPEYAGRSKKILVSDWVSRGDYLKMIPQYDLLALPSYSETFGMSLVEAMGQGLPVVSTFSGGVPFVVRNGVDGFLVNAGDIDALAQKLKCLVDDRVLRARMGLAAWNGCKERFSGENILNLLEHSYSELKKVYA